MWKKIWATEYTVSQGDIDGSAVPLAAMNVLGKHIRVTVEEEASKCCEKWRAGVAVACDWYDDTTSPQVGGVRCVIAPDFCAKCGKKL